MRTKSALSGIQPTHSWLWLDAVLEKGFGQGATSELVLDDSNQKMRPRGKTHASSDPTAKKTEADEGFLRPDDCREFER